MAYKYDDASYMYAQIDTAIEILAFEGKNMC